MLVKFPMRAPQPSSLITLSPPSSISPLTSRQQQRVRKLIDRVQVLVLLMPHLAEILIVWLDLFLTKNGV